MAGSEVSQDRLNHSNMFRKSESHLVPMQYLKSETGTYSYEWSDINFTSDDYIWNDEIYCTKNKLLQNLWIIVTMSYP